MTQSWPMPRPRCGCRGQREVRRPAAAVQKITNGGAHGVLITPRRSARSSRRRHDAQTRHVAYSSVCPRRVPVPLFDVVAKCITIRGSFVERAMHGRGARLCGRGKVKADIELRPSAINEVFHRLNGRSRMSNGSGEVGCASGLLRDGPSPDVGVHVVTRVVEELVMVLQRWLRVTLAWRSARRARSDWRQGNRAAGSGARSGREGLQSAAREMSGVNAVVVHDEVTRRARR